MLDHLEQLESYFGDALRSEAAGVEGTLGDAGFGLDKDEFDREEEAQAKEDLAAITQDLPRAKSELKNSGFQLTGVLVDIVTADFKDSLGRLLTPQWEKDNVMSTIIATAVDYFAESRLLLDGFFFDRLTGMVLTHLVEQYLQVCGGAIGGRSESVV